MELSKRKSASDCIRTLILFGFVYDVDYSYLRQYNETLGKISGNLNQIEKRISSTGNVYGEEMAEVKAIMDKEGAEMYSMGMNKFQTLAKDAGAILKIDRMVLVDLDVFDQYLESFRVK